MIKNNFRILKKPHANLQTIAKAPVKFQKDWPKTVGGVEGTRYLLKIRNHAPRTTESRKQCPSTFLRKGGGQLHEYKFYIHVIYYSKFAKDHFSQRSPSRSIFKFLAHLCWTFIHVLSLKLSSFSPFSIFLKNASDYRYP